MNLQMLKSSPPNSSFIEALSINSKEDPRELEDDEFAAMMLMQTQQPLFQNLGDTDIDLSDASKSEPLGAEGLGGLLTEHSQTEGPNASQGAFTKDQAMHLSEQVPSSEIMDQKTSNLNVSPEFNQATDKADLNSQSMQTREKAPLDHSNSRFSHSSELKNGLEKSLAGASGQFKPGSLREISAQAVSESDEKQNLDFRSSPNTSSDLSLEWSPNVFGLDLQSVESQSSVSRKMDDETEFESAFSDLSLDPKKEGEILSSEEGKGLLSQKEKIGSKTVRASHLPPKDIFFGGDDRTHSAQGIKEIQPQSSAQNLEPQSFGSESLAASDKKKTLEHLGEKTQGPGSFTLGSSQLGSSSGSGSVSPTSKKRVSLQEGGIPLAPQVQAETRDMKVGVTQGGSGKERLTSETVHELTQHISTLSHKGGGEMRIRITPEHLGELSIRVATSGSNVSLQIRASDPKTKKLIEESLDSLKETLSQKSLIVAQLDVSAQSFDQPSDHLAKQFQDGNSQGSFSQNSSSFDQRGFQENRSQDSRGQFSSQLGSWKSARIVSAPLDGRLGRSESSRIDVRA